MGLFSFVTDAGSKLGGAVFDALNDGEDIEKPETISPERVNELRKKNIEATLSQELGDEVSGVTVAVAGDKATLSGSVDSQTLAEKATLCAGNQFGISEVDCQLAVDNPEPEAQFYTVKSGDSLSKIAQAFYDDASKYTVIFEANKPMLTDPNKIFPGQELRIPAAQ